MLIHNIGSQYDLYYVINDVFNCPCYRFESSTVDVIISTVFYE